MRLSLRSLRQSFAADMVAGFTVAMVGTPQCMAYAAIAGVAPIYGLYTGIVPTIVGAISGSSSYLITGPSNATSLVTANVLQSFKDPAAFVQAVFALALLSGAIKLMLGFLKLGWIIRYVSNSVLMGFLAGASTLIVLGQVGNALGLPRATAGGAPALVVGILTSLQHANIYALLSSTLTMALLLSIKRIQKKLPAELVAIFAVGAIAYLGQWSGQGLRLVRDLGSLQGATLSLHVPALTLADWQALLPSAGAVALFSLVEAMSIAQAIALSTGERINPTREFIGQGLASLVGGFFQCIPSSGSPSRSAVNVSSGGRTRLAGVAAGSIVLLGIVVFAPLLDSIPVASLAGVIIITAYNLVNRHQLRLAWQSGMTSRLVLAVTFVATLLLPLHIAIYMSALLSIAIYVLESSKLQLTYLSQNPAGGFVEHSRTDILENPPAIAIVNVEGTLSFGAADDLEQSVREIIGAGVRVLILRLRRMRILDSEGVAALEHIVTYANRSGTRVLMCGVSDGIEATLQSSGLEGMLGAELIFRASDVLFASTQQALARAQEIILAERTHGD